MNIAVRPACLCAAAFLLSGVARAQAPKRGPSTPEERARAVKVAQELQSDPLDENAKADADWLVRWLVEIPDLGVDVCTGILGELGEKETGYPHALLATMLGAEAAFLIQHPEQAQDTQQEYLAGVDGALNAYLAIRKKDPRYHVAKLDDFLAKRSQGSLKDAVAESTKTLNCR
jgi:hypothetical protein